MPRCGAIYVPAETASTRTLRWGWGGACLRNREKAEEAGRWMNKRN